MADILAALGVAIPRAVPRTAAFQVSLDHERLELRAHAFNARAVPIRHSGKVLSLGAVGRRTSRAVPHSLG